MTIRNNEREENHIYSCIRIKKHFQKKFNQGKRFVHRWEDNIIRMSLGIQNNLQIHCDYQNLNSFIWKISSKILTTS